MLRQIIIGFSARTQGVREPTGWTQIMLFSQGTKLNLIDAAGGPGTLFRVTKVVKATSPGVCVDTVEHFDRGVDKGWPE